MGMADVIMIPFMPAYGVAFHITAADLVLGFLSPGVGDGHIITVLFITLIIPILRIFITFIGGMATGRAFRIRTSISMLPAGIMIITTVPIDVMAAAAVLEIAG